MQLLCVIEKTVFQAEINAIDACLQKSFRQNEQAKRIHILTDNQTALANLNQSANVAKKPYNFTMTKYLLSGCQNAERYM